MELNFTWLLLALPVAFALGWLASRMDLRQWRQLSQTSPKPFFKGLNHLLNAQEDEAIDAFIQTAQQDPNATELHFALGNLFRNRGDHDRAIRVYEFLLQRPDLPDADRHQARYALGQAFLRAGILDRAESHLLELTNTPYKEDAGMALLGLYERTSEWEKALEMARRLQADGKLDFSTRMAHYHCEVAAQPPTQSPSTNGSISEFAYQHALALAPWHVRTHMELANAEALSGQSAAAWKRLNELVTQVPKALPLATQHLAELAHELGETDALTNVLQTALSQNPSLDVLETLLKLTPSTHERNTLLLQYLEQESSVVVAADWIFEQSIQSHDAETSSLPEPVHRALQRACAPLRRYRCAACGFETTRHFWQCPGCQTWDSYPTHRVDEL